MNTADKITEAEANLATAKAKTRAAWNAYNYYSFLYIGNGNELAQAVRDAAANEAAAEAVLINARAAAIAR